MEWNDDVIGRLRELWAEGHSTAEIGRRLGVSKNAIVGKAHRLDLPARPSPIRREGSEPLTERRAAPPRRVEGPTLPPLASSGGPAEAIAPIAVVTMAPPAPVQPKIVPPRPVLVAPPRPQPLASSRPYGRIVTCCWPIGEPGTKTFRFCDDRSEPGKPYCEDHAKLAYVKVRDRREDAA